jgi:hypothetical protein
MKRITVTTEANEKRLIIHNMTGGRLHTITGEEIALSVKTFWQEKSQQVAGQDIVLAMQEETPYSDKEEYYLLASDAEEYRVPTAAEREAKEEELKKYKAAIDAKFAANKAKIDAARAAIQARVDLAMGKVVAAFDGHRSGRMGKFGMSPDLTRALNDAGFGDVLEDVAIALGVYSRAASANDIFGNGYSKVD